MRKHSKARPPQVGPGAGWDRLSKTAANIRNLTLPFSSRHREGLGTEARLELLISALRPFWHSVGPISHERCLDMDKNGQCKWERDISITSTSPLVTNQLPAKHLLHIADLALNLPCRFLDCSSILQVGITDHFSGSLFYATLSFVRRTFKLICRA